MSDVNYNKIKHLVDVDDDIFAVFTVSLENSQMENLSIAQSAKITEDFVEKIFVSFKENFGGMVEENTNLVGHLKWSVHETDRIRLLIIYEKHQTVIVLVKSNISLSESVDNILGYYYET
ncbi:MAG TPA: hypothetical protein VJ772_04455 [Nitrososphaeraceae archaeon]|nr:hypothetical protein [Nitrososphaeraceae archaeon]